MNHELARFDVPEHNFELIIDQNTGEVFASQMAIARMVNISPTAIRNWLKKGETKTQPKVTKIPTSKGLQTAYLWNVV